MADLFVLRVHVVSANPPLWGADQRRAVLAWLAKKKKSPIVFDGMGMAVEGKGEDASHRAVVVYGLLNARAEERQVLRFLTELGRAISQQLPEPSNQTTIELGTLSKCEVIHARPKRPR